MRVISATILNWIVSLIPRLPRVGKPGNEGVISVTILNWIVSLVPRLPRVGKPGNEGHLSNDTQLDRKPRSQASTSGEAWE